MLFYIIRQTLLLEDVEAPIIIQLYLISWAHWSSEVNIGSVNDLVLSGKKPLPEPMLTQLCHHVASLGHNEFTDIQSEHDEVQEIDPRGVFNGNFSTTIQIEQKFPFVYIKILIVITAKFCTWHNSYAVEAYAKFCSDLMSNLINDILIFHRIQIVIKTLLVKWACYHAAFYWIFVSRPVVTHRILTWFTKTQSCICSDVLFNKTLVMNSYSPQINLFNLSKFDLLSTAVSQKTGPFYLCGLTLIPAWISNHIHYNVWDEVTYPFTNFNREVIEVWGWICNFIPHFAGHVITYPCWDEKLIHVINKGGNDNLVTLCERK